MPLTAASSLGTPWAIDAPNFSIEHFPSSFYPHEREPAQVQVEDRVPEKVRQELRRKGHRLVVGSPWSEGRVTAVARIGAEGLLLAGANARGMQAYAAGR